LGLLRRPAFAVANAVAVAMNFGSLGLLFLLSLFLQAVQQRSASAAGAAVLPLFLPLVVLAPLAGRATARWGPRPTMLAGLGVAGVALYGSVAGSPADPAPFLAGLHLTGLITAILFLVAGVATAIAVPTRS